MKEIWRDIKDYEGKYQVSNLGNVKSLNYNHTENEKLLLPAVCSKGYLFVHLCKNGKIKNYLVHRLVADAFIPDKTNFKYFDEKDRLEYINNLDKLQVNHKDEDQKNNNVNNLEWCTNYYNQLYGTHNEKIAKANSKTVYQYDLNGNFIQEWPSAYEIQRQTGYKQGVICRCCLGKRKQAYGFIWSYEIL